MFSGAIRQLYSARQLNPTNVLFTRKRANHEQLLILRDVNRKIRNPDCDKPTFIRSLTDPKILAK